MMNYTYPEIFKNEYLIISHISDLELFQLSSFLIIYIKLLWLEMKNAYGFFRTLLIIISLRFLETA